MTRLRILAACLIAGAVLPSIGTGEAGVDGAPHLVVHVEPRGAAVGEVAVLHLVDEINLATGAPTRTHEQRVELLLHIRARIDAVVVAAAP